MLIEVGLQCVYLRLNTLGVGIADVGGGGVKITAYRYCGGGRGRCQEILCFFGGCCDADFKFFITANAKTRALRRYKELKVINKKIFFNEVLKSIKNRDKSDYNRKVSPLIRTKDSVLINTTNLTKRSCFLKIKQIMDRKLKA